jgi:hypothetical protein
MSRRSRFYGPVILHAEKTIKDHADKYNRENGFIYTQRIPVDAPEAPEAKSLTEVGSRAKKERRALQRKKANPSLFFSSSSTLSLLVDAI